MFSEKNTLPPDQRPERKEKSEFNDLIIVTSTLYPAGENEVVLARRQLGLEFFRKANEFGIRCVVNDGGSDEEFLEELKKLKNVELSIEPKLGMGESTREAMGRAAGHSDARFFMWTVPEKTGLLNEETLGKLISELRSEKADIVIANREKLANKDSAVSKSMPSLQRKFEMRANKRANRILYGEDSNISPQLDIWFGAKMMNRVGLQYFLDYKSSLGDRWDSVVVPIVNAHSGGKRVVGVEVPFEYASAQKKSEEGSRHMDKKRWEQYRKILAAMGDTFWKDKETK